MRVLVDDSILSKVNFIPDNSAQQPNSSQQAAQDFQPSKPAQPNKLKENFGKALDALSMFKEGQQNMALGATKGVYDTARSVADLVPGVNLPDIDLYSSRHGDDQTSRLEYGAGYLGGQLLGDTGVYKGVSKIPGLVSNGLAANSAKGAISLAATNENQPGGRAGGALLGAALGPLAGIGAKNVADTAVALRKGSISQYNHLYNTMFKDIEDSGLKKVELPGKINTKLINRLPSSKDQLESLSNFMSNPTFQNAHTAQSELGKLIAKSNPYALSDVKKNALDEAIRAQDMIKNSFGSTLEKKGQTELAQRFKDITAGYAKDVVPYNHKAIRKYQAGRMDPDVLVKILSRDKDFLFNTKESFPELVNRKKAVGAGKYIVKQLQDFGKYAGLGSLLYGAGKGTSGIDDLLGNNQ